MSKPSPRSSLFWLIIPVVAFGFLVWADYLRVQRVIYTTGLVAEPLKPDAGSATGFAGGARELIVPEHNNDSYHWIVQTQQMLAQGEARVRQVDYDNAPFGRAVESPSPYRWWLGFVAWLDHRVSGRSPGLAVERAALFADPLLHLLLLVGATAFVAWQFGVFPAALFSAGLAVLFPFAGGFIPGAPDDQGLSLVCAIWSLLPLLAGLRGFYAPAPSAETGERGSNRRADRWFLVAGVIGGFGVWVSVASQIPILIGIFLGGLIAAWAARSAASATSRGSSLATGWWSWGLGGAGTILVAYLIEYFPDHLASWQLRAVHPLYGLGWLGFAAMLVQAEAGIRGGKLRWSVRGGVILILGLVAVAVLPVVMWKTKNEGFLALGVSSLRLTKLPGGAVASSLWAWLLHDGITGKVWATLLPSLLVLPAGGLMLWRGAPPFTRVSTALMLGPALLALGFASWHLRGWSNADGILLVLLVACAGLPGPARFARFAWIGFVGAMVALGAVQLVPQGGSGKETQLTQAELVGLIERDLARWLSKHAGPGGAVVLAPPKETTTLFYYGGMRGLGTLAWENVDGIGAAIRIVSASTPEEARELISRRSVTHLVIPSWDTYLDEYARIGMGQVEGTFLSQLHNWKTPLWLRPVAYQLPTITGFENQSVKILEVVEDQDDAVVLGRIAEYFVEMGQLDLAGSVGQALRRFPSDLGALVARAQVELARGDTAAFPKTVELLRARLTGKGDRALLWDRRASLAVVLARAKLNDLARVQVERCLAEVDEAGLRLLTTGALYRLQVLAKAYGLTIADPRLRGLARDLLPDDLRSRL